jgi:hypothetical protein
MYRSNRHIGNWQHQRINYAEHVSMTSQIIRQLV